MVFYGELWLYHGLSVTADLAVSTTSSGGPWTTLSLPTSMPITEALAAWATQAVAAFGGSWTFELDTTADRVELSASVPWWLEVSATMADLLGLSGTALASAGGAHQIYGTPSAALGVAVVEGIHVPLPREFEQVELREYRAGRHSAYPQQRVRMVDAVELLIDGARYDTLKGLFKAGKQRLVVGNAADDFDDAGDLDGYHDVYPLQELSVERVEGGDGLIVAHFSATKEDPS